MNTHNWENIARAVKDIFVESVDSWSWGTIRDTVKKRTPRPVEEIMGKLQRMAIRTEISTITEGLWTDV
jgi:hypothetical protein